MSGPSRKKIPCYRILQRNRDSFEQFERNLVSTLSKSILDQYKGELIWLSHWQWFEMSPRKVIEVRLGEKNSQKWPIPLTEGEFNSFIARNGEYTRKIFGEGSLFSPLLLGKFFDPADAFPLWEFESEALLPGPRSTFKKNVDWSETDFEYVLRAQLPEGARKCLLEVCGLKAKILEIVGKWRGRESEEDDWKAGHWWEHGYVRCLELLEIANWKKIEACIINDILLEIKIPKWIPDSDLHQT